MDAETLVKNAAQGCGWGQEAIDGAIYSFLDSLNLLSFGDGLFEAYIVSLVYHEWKHNDPHLTRGEVRVELGLG